MAKVITQHELAQLVSHLLTGNTQHPPLEGFDTFMTAIAEVVCDHFGGAVHHVATPSVDPEEPGIFHIGIHGTDAVPKNGGVWANYDPDGDLFDAHPIEPASHPKEVRDLWTVQVTRIGYGHRDIAVHGPCTRVEAIDRALAEAGNHYFGEHSSEYQADSARPV